MPGATSRKPRVLLLIDKPRWAFRTIADAVMCHLRTEFSFSLLASADRPRFREGDFDILHVLYEYETWHLPFLTGKAKVLKGVYSHYWQEWGLDAWGFYDKHLREAHSLTVPNLRLLGLLRDLPPAVHLVREGVDTDLFSPGQPRHGALRVGWVGDPTRDIKRFPWIRQACAGTCELRVADGALGADAMRDFYRSVDVVACASKAEGAPRPLLEGMACGAFPVSFDVGIARDLIEDERNGLIVQEQSVDALRSALAWCAGNVTAVRRMGAGNPARIRKTRRWEQVLPDLAAVYRSLL